MPSKPEVIKERRAYDPEYAAKQRSYGKKWEDKDPERARRLNRDRAAARRAKDRSAYNEKMRVWREKNKDRINEKQREYRKNHPERFRAEDRRRYVRNPLKSKLRNYNLTEEQFYVLLEKQNHCCAICGVHQNDAGKKSLAIDHCHIEGHVRGLLCSRCNTGLGQFRDNVRFLAKAIEYLKE